MRRVVPFLVGVLAFTGIACPPAPPVDTNKKDDAKVVIAPPEPLKDAEQLKTRIEAAVQQVHQRDLQASHGFWTVFHGILGSGLEKTMLTDPKSKQRINAIDYIANGGEIRGLKFEPTKYGLDVLDVKTFPDLQFIAQGHQDQFIAEMAQWGMPRDRTFKVGKATYKFEDFAHHSKMRASVKQNQELSWAIIIIAQYYGTDHRWTNSANEPLTFDDVVRYEVDASITEAACGGTHRLFGLTWAYYLHLKNGGKKTGVWIDVHDKIEAHKQLARKLRNPDSSFSTDYFKGPGNVSDPHLRIGTTGHIVEWLALAMTDEELRSPWMQDTVNALVQMILEMKNSEVDGGALYHATHGLHLYHVRVFGKAPDYLPLPPRR
jgi:hypothetical protein